MAEAIFVVYAHIAKIANIVNVNIEFNMDQMTQTVIQEKGGDVVVQEPREVGSERQKGSDQQREVNTEYQPVCQPNTLCSFLVLLAYLVFVISSTPG